MSRRSVLPVIRTPHLLVAGLAAFGLHAAAATVLFWPEHRTGAIGAGAGGLEIGLAGAIGAPSNSVDSAEEDAPPVAESDALPPPAETVADAAAIPETAAQDAAIPEAAMQEAPIETALAADAAPPLPAPAEPVQTALLAPETPVQDAPVQDAPVEETSVEEAVVEEAVVEEASVEEAAVPERAVQEDVVQEEVVREQDLQEERAALTAPRPVARPEPPARTQSRTPPQKKTPPPARQAARPAPAAARPSARPPAARPPAARPPAARPSVDAQSGESAAAAAPGGGGGAAAPGGGDPGAEADYQARVRARLARAKTYPRRAQARRQEGVGRLRFTVDRSGRALSHVIVRSSGHALLDKAMVDMITRAQPFPPFPASLAKSEITMEFDVRFRMP